MSEFIQDLLSPDKITSREDEIENELRFYLSINQGENIFLNIDENDMKQFLSFLIHKNFYKMLELLFKSLQLNPYFENFFSIKEYLEKALYDSVSKHNDNYGSLKVILTYPQLNPNVINPDTGLNALHCCAILICQNEKNETLTDEERKISQEYFKLLLTSPKINVLTPVGNVYQLEACSIINISKYSNYLTNEIPKYLEGRYSFSFGDLSKIFEISLCFNKTIKNVIKTLNNGDIVSESIEELCTHSSYFKNFYQINFVPKNMKPQKLELRYASKILTFNEYSNFQDNEKFLLVGRLSDNGKTLCFDFYDLKQLVRYLVQSKPFCPAVDDQLLTTFQNYSSSKNCSFLIENVIF